MVFLKDVFQKSFFLSGAFLKGVLLIFVLLSGVRFVSQGDHWMTELPTHFPMQYGVASLILFILLLWRKQWFAGAIAAILAIFNWHVILDDKPTPVKDIASQPFRVYAANVWHINVFEKTLLEEFRDLDTEIAFITEMTPDILHSVRPEILKYPYRVERPKKGGKGFLFLSKFPVQDFQVIDIRSHGNRPLLVANLLIDQQVVTFYGVHPLNPAWTTQFPERNNQLLWLAQQVADNPKPVIVAGDFNLTPYSPIFEKLISISNLRDSANGFGWQPSWPTMFPIFWLPIDHILVSPEIRVHSRQIGNFIGSDHYPVIADISLRERSKEVAFFHLETGNTYD